MEANKRIMEKDVRILVVDDDTAHRTMLKTLLGGWGYPVAEADDGSGAIEAVQKQVYDLVLMDIRMLKVSGIEALGEIKAYNPAIPVIIMTAFSSVETAVDSLKMGAYDYLTKPLEFDKLKITIARAVEHVRLKAENKALKAALDDHFDRRKIVGQSPVMVHLLEAVAQVAPSEATILISGESGTGKEMIAGAIHYNSHRKHGPFVKINCAALTETLLESELFGHEKGAFTGADRLKEGRFVLANGGSLFLDEVSEMSPSMQVKLLRVLQEWEVTRVGGEAVIKVDVRVIAATNRSLTERIESGEFREDLYYRLNVVNLELPALRFRRNDIPLLAQHFLEDLAVKNRKEIKGFTPDAMNCLIRYHWPGNVRELMNAVERAVVLSRSEYLGAETFSSLGTDGLPSGASNGIIPGGMANLTLEEVEKEAVLQTLSETGGNKSEAARRLGITRKTLHKKLKKYGTGESDDASV